VELCREGHRSYLEHWPDPALLAFADSLKCSPDPPWSDTVIYWSGDVYRIESVSPGYPIPKPWCDASRPDWKAILQEWKDQKRLNLYLCEGHAFVLALW
jgi:hypothetical protein